MRLVVASFLAVAFFASSALPSLAVGGIVGNLQGTVVDTTSQQPVANATITAVAPSGRYTAKTDSKGFFQINGMTVDTYSVSIQAPSYEGVLLSGVTVQGDQTVNLNTQGLSKNIKTIGRITSRSQTNVFQPAQTIDSVTISGARATTALGKKASTDENALALSAPGVQLTNRGSLTIRGGLSNEVGYQFDGVNFQEPYLTNDAARGAFTGLGSLQVIAGAGDPSQGNAGSGILNFTVKRGARPAFGYLDFEATAPFYGHQGSFEYGFATPDGRFSNYATYVAQRQEPVYGPRGYDSSTLNTYNAVSFTKTDDIINNSIYRFGKDSNQSIQMLYRNRYTQGFGDEGGIDNRTTAFFSPITLKGFISAVPGPIQALPGFDGPSFIRNTVAVGPYAPTSATVNGTETALFQPLRFLKFEYTNNLNATTYAAIRSYNYESLSGGSNYTTDPLNPSWSQVGGKRAGISADITKTVSDKHTVTIGGLLENAHPERNSYTPATGVRFGIGGVDNYANVPAGTAMPSFYDFLTPANSNAPISAANPCPIANACYIYSQLGAGGSTKVPAFGVNYTETDYQSISGYIRDQFTATKKLKLDLGVRVDHENFKQGHSPFNADLNNPTDVDTSFVAKKFTQPTVTEPRVSAVYQFSNSDSLRAGFGRSVEFASAQTFGTPGALYGLDNRLFNVAPLPGTNTADPATWSCGSGYNAAQIVASGANKAATGGGFTRCQNYAQQIFWGYDQNFDAPDVGNNAPPTYANIDLTYQKQLKNGIGLRMTAYTKRGYSLPILFLINQFTDASGAIAAQVFAVDNLGINRTNGLEFGMSLPEKPYGLTGYLSATYSNVFNSNPPLIAGEDQLPLVSKSSLALQNVYRAGYVSPFVINAGASYKTRNGFRINPIFNYDRGYPIGAGNLTPSGARQAVGFLIDGSYRTIVQTNLDQATVPAYNAGYFSNGYTPAYRGSYTATNYVDPINPGSYYAPYIAATRGTPEAATAGGVLSRPRLSTDLSVEYARNKNTFGLLIHNLVGTRFSEPTLNPLYQPVATGVAGPLTGQRAQGNPTNPFYSLGNRNIPDAAFGKNPYVEIPNNPTTYRFYYQIAL